MANIITLVRIFCSIGMLFVPVFSPAFYALYITAGVSDMVDGTIARKTGTASDFGSKLDTAADFVLVVVCLIKVIPVLDIPIWLIIWTTFIALIKVINIISGYVKRKKFVAVHTVMNKLTGIVLFLLPLTLSIIELKYSGVFVCALATIAAIQEGHYIRTGRCETKKFKNKNQLLRIGEFTMTNMEQYKRPGKHVIDISTWSRRGNFEFFSGFINPNLGVTVRVDVRHAYNAAKAKGVSFFLSYFHAILAAVNEIQEFRYRFDREGNVVCYDRIDGLAPIHVKEKDNFAEMIFPFSEDFDTFCQTAQQVIELAASTDPYEQAEMMTDYNVILVSALPKLDFTSLCNTQRDQRGNDYPLCVIGKMGDDKTMPVSITVHHGFADGEHISRFYELLQEKLDEL